MINRAARAAVRSARASRPRTIRPSYPAPCAAGCGRTARRMIRVRQVHQLQDAQTGAPLPGQTQVWMVPYCMACTPDDGGT